MTVQQKSARNVKWIEGLRGLASLLVVIAHLHRGWDYDLYYPKSHEGDTPRLLQLPILRIPPQGRMGVPTFAFLTGFVCALKPLKLARQGSYNTALVSIAKSAFRRPPRLIMPASIAMFCAWLLCQFGAFTVAHRCDAMWLRVASPKPDPSLLVEVKRLFATFFSTWTTGKMDYDDHQWALLPLLKGAMEAYIVLMPVIFMKYRYRMLVYTIMILYFFLSPKADNETFGLQIFYGMFLCDFMMEESTQKYLESKRWIRGLVSPILIFIGLILASYPAEHADWSTWSDQMTHFGQTIFPETSNLPKRFSALAADFIILGICLNPLLRDLLCTPKLLFLGKNSYAVYMTHGTMLRTVLCYFFYGISGQPWEEHFNQEKNEWEHGPYLPRRPTPLLLLGLAVWFPMLYTLANLWTNYVDAWCGRVTQRLEDRMFEDEKSVPLLG